MSDEYLKIYAAGGGGGGGNETRYPVDDPEGVYYRKGRDGKNLPTGALSVTETEVLDLISEGEIAGLVTGIETFVGQEGSIGYDSISYQAYPEPPNLTNARWLRSVYWNQIPLVDSNNQFNFSTIDVSSSRGTPNGTDIASNSEITITKSIGESLLAPYADSGGELFGSSSDYVKTYRIFNKSCVAVKVNVRFGPLLQNNTTEEEYGDVEQTAVEYTIEYRAIFSDGKQEKWSVPTKERVVGKLTNPYLCSTRIDFEKNSFRSKRTFSGWEIRIIRLTPDSISSTLQNKTYIDSITEVYGNKFTFPNSALVRSKFDAKYFSQIPERAFEVKLLKVAVPNNYDVNLRKYTGTWDGTFDAEKKWTNNPAWCFYDLITNKRYGLGNYIEEDYFDKWTLYKIAQYCDVLVPDGKGGLEPRFTCNLIINNKEEAFKVLNDFASIFRSLLYYSNGTLFLNQDSEAQPSDAVVQFTNANVENGNFIYSTAPKASRSTTAIVRYNDPNNFYRPAVELVQDVDLIKKYGRKDLEITSFGCTSRGQAIREGRYALYTQNYQSETISFVAGLEGNLLRPGDLIKVTDQYRNYNRLGGRVFSGVDTNTIHLDSDLTGYFRGKEPFNFTLTLSTPTFNYEPGLVTDLTSTDIPKIHPPHTQITGFNLSNVTTDSYSLKTKITLPGAFNSENHRLIDYSVWSIDCTGDFVNESEYWKIINVQEKDAKFEVFGLKFEFDKFGFIESGIKFVATELNNQPPQEDAISNLVLSLGDSSASDFTLNFSFIKNGDVYNNSPVIILIQTGRDFTEEDVLNYTTNDKIVASQILPPNQTNGAVNLSDNETYYVRAYVIGENGQFSEAFTKAQTGINFLKTVGEIVISSLTIDGNKAVNTAGSYSTAFFSGANPKVIWQVGYQNNNIYPGDIYYRVSIREPSDSNTPSNVIYYEQSNLTFSPKEPFAWVFDQEINKNINKPPYVGPFRTFDVVVEAHDADGNSSAGGNFLNNINDIGMQDSAFTRGLGYDILYVANSGFTGAYLTPDGESETTSLTNGAFFTSQSIKADGGVIIQLKTGINTLPDLAGGYLYYSDSTFTEDDVVSAAPGIEVAPFLINGLKIYPASVDIPLGLPSSVNTKYIAYRLYDTFDREMETVPSNLDLSNVMEITRDNFIDGTANQLVKFDPSSDKGLSAANIYQNGSAIGVGTVPVSNYFHVSGLLLRFDVDKVASASDAGQYMLINISGVNYYLKLYV